MDGGQAKLTRTNSSLLRSSPTIRSSIHSMSSIAETSDPDGEHLVKPLTGDDDESKKRRPATPRRSGSARFTPVATLLVSLSLSFPFLFFYYRRTNEIPTSENLLLGLILVAVGLFFAGKNKALINQKLTLLTKKFNLYPGLTRKKTARQVQWFIGDQTGKGNTLPEVIREGVEFYSNGDYYEGEFHKRKCNGRGVYNFFVNGRYEGDWVEGRYDGFGIESWARGSKYRGQYRGGLRHGHGVYRFYTGDSYSGEWCKGQSHGVGVQTCSDGSCFVGEFKFGVKHGLGVYHFRNGDRYAGEYFGDKIHGFGVYHFANGHCYEGSWHEGRKQGYGMYTFRSGDMKCGEWDASTLKNPLPQFNDAVLRAVQAARRTAENAVHLRRVDEQVNRAVHAANRAATAARVAAVKAVQNRMDGRLCDTSV